VGAEVARIFEIGWFSYYMLWIALVLLSPVSWVASFAKALARLLEPLDRMLSEERPTFGRVLSFGLALLFLYAACGVGLDLPGALAACGIACLGVLAALFRAYRQQLPGAIEQRTLAGVIACASLWGAISLSSVRFDFYRRWAGETSRLGEIDQAITLYRKAEAYAPPGASRARQIEQLERQR
jgi:hypothetical protein